MQKPLPVHGLADRLPDVAPEAARLARVAHDPRFARWVNAAMGNRDAQVSRPPRGAVLRALQVRLGCEGGEFVVSVDPDAWPALALASALPEAPLARDVAEALLAPLLGRLRPDLPGLAVRAVAGACACDPAPLALDCRSARIGLESMDPGVARLVGIAMRRAGLPLSCAFKRLRLPGRIRLFIREFTSQRLNALAAGDIVVAGASFIGGVPLRARLSFGTGIIMQADVQIDTDASTATLVSTPGLEDEPEYPQDNAESTAELGAIGDLALPVAFELDSARVSLEELSSLGEGSVLELDVPAMDAMVRLVCFGQIVGTGQLVLVGERLGVRIIRMGLGPADTFGGRA